jgi:hypothetical protein
MFFKWLNSFFRFTSSIKFMQMKTVKQLVLLAVLTYTGSLHAQQAAELTNTKLNLPFAQPVPKLKQASDFVKKAAIPGIKKPTPVHLDLVAQLKKIQEQCPYLRKEKATLKLEGERTDNSSVKLEWETTNGWNNHAFTLQRSLGDTFHFETINSVWAKPIAGIKDLYRQPDENGYNKTSYYRVQLQLRDGKSLYSNIAAVKGYQVNLLNLFPNPVADRVTISVFSEKDGLATISTFDASGKIAVQQTEILQAGLNKREMNIFPLAAGVYTVKVLLPDHTQQVARLVKQ